MGMNAFASISLLNELVSASADITKVIMAV